jgi:hypothetical protein
MAHLTAASILQQLREAIPYGHSYRFIIHNHDAIFSAALDAPLDWKRNYCEMPREVAEQA